MNGLAVFCGMVGCPVLVLLVSTLPGLIHWVSLLIVPGSWCKVLIRLIALSFGLLLFFWNAEDLAMEVGVHPCVWTVGSLEPYLTAGISVAGAGVYLPARGLLFGAVDFFLSTGQVVAFSVKRLFGLWYARTTQFLCLPCLSRKELKFGRGAALLVAWCGLLVGFLGDLVGFCLVLFVGIFSRLCDLRWEQCSHGLTSRPSESVLSRFNVYAIRVLSSPVPQSSLWIFLRIRLFLD